MQLDFRNCKWVITCPTPRKIKETVEKYEGLHGYKAIKFVTYVTCTSPQFAWRQRMNSKFIMVGNHDVGILFSQCLHAERKVKPSCIFRPET